MFNLDDIETGIMDNMLDVTVRLSLTTDDLGGIPLAVHPGQFAAGALDGDFNNDGKVDAADYVVWRKGFGTTYTHVGLPLVAVAVRRDDGTGGRWWHGWRGGRWGEV